jgi:RNase P subunit RPR2
MQNHPAVKAARNKRTKEVAMTTVASLRGIAHETICDKCGEPLIAPEWAEYFSEEGVILNLWSCTSCGNRFETEALAPADAEAKLDRQVLEEFFPSLLVA